MILSTNLLVLLSVILCMVDDIMVIAFGRFLYGMAAGAFTVFVPKFINEVAPPEFKGPFGAISQFTLTLAIFIASLMCIVIPDIPREEI